MQRSIELERQLSGALIDPPWALRHAWMEVTPQLAKEWLAHANPNRKIKYGKKEQFKADMAAGRWQLTGDPIGFNTNGGLDNGNHRLLACVESNVSFRTLVVWGLTTSAHAAIDTGAPRSRSDLLTWKGEKNAGDLSAAISLCWQYERGSIRHTNIRPSHQQLLDWLDANPRIRQSVQRGQRIKARVGISRSAVAVVHYETSRVSLEDAEVFFHLLLEGADLGSRDPIFALRRWAEGWRTKRDKPSTIVQIAHVMKACNAWREGRELSLLQWRAGGASAEPFPEVWIEEAVAATHKHPE